MTDCTVLGGAGYIGSHLVDHLRLKGHRVSVPRKGEDIAKGQSLGHIFYCAGLTADFRTRPYDTVRAHVSLLSEILENYRFDSLLYLSSTRVYQGLASTSEASSCVVQPQTHSDLYNLSKLMGESLCHASARERVRVARLSNVIGRQGLASADYFPMLCREAASGKVVLQSTPDSQKDYIHIDDAARLLTLIALGGRRSVYNVASGLNITNDTLIEKIATLYPHHIDVTFGDKKFFFPRIDTSEIAREFDFEAASPLSLIHSTYDV